MREDGYECQRVHSTFFALISETQSFSVVCLIWKNGMSYGAGKVIFPAPTN